MGNYWKIGAGVILILFGVYILDILPFKIPGMSFDYRSKNSGIAGSILFGLVVGSLTSLGTLCCNPIFPIVVAASLVTGSSLWGFSLLLTYAFGFGFTLAVAMLGIGLGIGKLSKVLSKFAIFIKYAGGITLIVLGFYFLITI
jgi:cytochrome c biogenesis protein CcdA